MSPGFRHFDAGPEGWISDTTIREAVDESLGEAAADDLAAASIVKLTPTPYSLAGSISRITFNVQDTNLFLISAIVQSADLQWMDGMMVGDETRVGNNGTSACSSVEEEKGQGFGRVQAS
jgi:hypothetical protein